MYGNTKLKKNKPNGDLTYNYAVLMFGYYQTMQAACI